MDQGPRPSGMETSPGGPRDRDDASSLPERVGVYRIEGRLGRGGMGEVFLAWDERLERRVAIKRIRPDAGLTAGQRERFRREARLAARLSHSAIVQIHDLVTEGADDAIVMEYVEGETLAARLGRGGLDTAEALRLAAEIAAGLAAAHEAGLIHRDLKAANVIITPAGHAKILDFGLARPVGKSEETPLTRRGMIVGTLHAMSPEQARGQAVDERSDLFSFGVLLYEMLTGRPPFCGESPVAVLHHLIYEPPPSVRSLRPDLAAEIEGLLDRLLAKDRQDRPGSAGEVIAALERLPASTVQPAPLPDSVYDRPTAAAPRWREPLPAVRSRGALPSTIMGFSVRGRRRTILTGGAVVVLVAALATTLWLGRPTPPLRVAVARPEILSSAGDEQLGLAASGVLTAELSSLASLQGVAAIDPREAGQGGKSPKAMARTAAAHEVLIATVEREGALSRVSLRRVRGSDGAVLWSETFRVPADPGSLRLLNDAVASRLRRAYSAHRVRPGTPELDVRDEDYAAFLEVRRRIASGQMELEPEIARLEEIVRSSPRFLEAQILAARFNLSRFESTADSVDLDRATRLAKQALDLAPDDPRPLLLSLHTALAAHRDQEAEEILARLDRELPGDPEVLPLRADLVEQQGRAAEALALQRTAVEWAPSWQNLYRLAQLAARQGHIDEARAQIATILHQAPDNFWAQEELGQIELLYGDLARAEQIYLRLAPMVPLRAYDNVGMARFLSGHYVEAADAYRRSLAAGPNHATSLLNLADTEVELGHPAQAQILYRRVLDLYAANANVRRGPLDALIEAQCLARLGQTRQAIQITQEALRRTPDNPIFLQESALIHSLVDDRSSALNDAQAALEKGLQPHWFSASAFRSLRESPELRPWFQRSTAMPPLKHQ